MGKYVHEAPFPFLELPVCVFLVPKSQFLGILGSFLALRGPLLALVIKTNIFTLFGENLEYAHIGRLRADLELFAGS